MLNSRFKIVLITYYCLFVGFLFAANPLIKDIGMSDPHIRVFNDTIFLFTGHDDSPTDKLWVMKDWRVFKSTDMLNWELATTISPLDNYMDNNSKDCWAGDAATRNGKYYFYFSDQKRGIGVMKASTPGGRYIDALGKPLVAPMHDPTLFVDDDANKTPYIIYGDKAGGGFRIAKVNEDMISLAEETKSVIINGKQWQDAPNYQDKNYLFKYNGTYYLSWGRDYATSKNVYGPYECVGAVGTGFNLNSLAHGSFFWWKGQFYHIWTYYITSGFKYRECIISYCHIDEQGKINTDTDFLSKHFATGVGQYEASWSKIEAEWYSEKQGDITKKTSTEGGFDLTNIKNNNWIKFANVNFDSVKNTFTARIKNIGGSGKIEIRLNNPAGSIIGEVIIPSSDKMNSYVDISSRINDVIGKQDVYLKFVGSSSFLFDLASISFKNEVINSNKNTRKASQKVFPNPSKDGCFNLSSSEKWEVFSLLGVKIEKGEGTKIDLARFSPTIYLLRTENNYFDTLFYNQL